MRGDYYTVQRPSKAGSAHGLLFILALLSRRGDAWVVYTSLCKIVLDECDDGGGGDGAKGTSGMLTISPPLSGITVGSSAS